MNSRREWYEKKKREKFCDDDFYRKQRLAREAKRKDKLNGKRKGRSGGSEEGSFDQDIS